MNVRLLTAAVLSTLVVPAFAQLSEAPLPLSDPANSVFDIKLGALFTLQENGKNPTSGNRAFLSGKLRWDHAMSPNNSWFSLKLTRDMTQLGYSTNQATDLIAGAKFLLGSEDNGDYVLWSPFGELQQDFRDMPGYRQGYVGVTLAGRKSYDYLAVEPVITFKVGGDWDNSSGRGYEVNPAIRVTAMLTDTVDALDAEEGYTSPITGWVYAIYNGNYRERSRSSSHGVEAGVAGIYKLSADSRIEAALSYQNGRQENIGRPYNGWGLSVLFGQKLRF